ncbi:MAG: hypothetical protein HY975_03165 [Candidatus Kerfeldbacteria bacterium]|nr:hypothetical protein [Candidatus Kerfeldbacteria bacterium]
MGTKPTAAQASLFPAKRRRLASKKPAAKSPAPLPRPAGKKTWLSATGIETMRRCPRCFWLQYNLRIYQPEGIVSRLANRFDGVIKRYFDLYRGTTALPPLVAGQIDGLLEQPFQEKYFATIDNDYGFLGKLDECVVRSDHKYTPVDHKTASSDPTTRELIPAYQFQLDSYAWLLEQNRKPTTGIGHLIYFYPSEGEKLHEGFPMQVTVKTLPTDPSRVRPAILGAIAVLRGPLPAAAPECPFCLYVETVRKF